jgi:GNAT superfamily N-acetyltransferase/predicted nucleic acid-binding protein
METIYGSTYMSMPPIKLLLKKDALIPFVDIVKERAKSDRTAFGFMPDTFYREAAFSEKLIVAANSKNGSYIGHLIFGGVFPNGRVYQVFVDPKLRKQGIAAKLFETLFDVLNSRQFTQVQARVASDLKAANFLYERMGFVTRKIVDGGKTTGRRINIKVKDLEAPTLFTFVHKPAIAKDLNIPERTTARSPTYVIDLNVVFDAVKKRVRSRAAGILFQASSRNHISVAISRELKNELERTASSTHNDPMLKMVSHFWTLEIPASPRVKEISKKIAPVVFPERSTQGIMTVQDKSDLIHLITAIENNAAGFVTSETKILSASNHLRSEYGLEVISLYDLAELVQDDALICNDLNSSGAFSDDFTAHRTTKNDDPIVKNAVNSLCVEARFLPEPVRSPADAIHFMVVSDKNSEPLGFAWWTNYPGPTPKNDSFITADENSDYCQGIIDFLCEKIIGDSCKRDVSLVQIKSNEAQTSIRTFLIEHGFRASSGKHSEETTLQKVCVGQPLYKKNWDQIRLKIAKVTGGIQLPKRIPETSGNNELIEFSGHRGKKFHIAQQDLEHLLSPTLLIYGDRDGVIVPIIRTWADDLFANHKQGSLLTQPEAVVRRERVYFSTPSTLGTLRPGRVILFYESGKVPGGRMALISIGRITQSNVSTVKDIEDSLLRKGVIDKRMLQTISSNGKQTITLFDNIMTFTNPISYQRLNALGCNNGSNFVTATPISPTQLETILLEGRAHV